MIIFGSSEDIKHIDEVMKLLAVFADKRFMDNMVISNFKGRPRNMCEVLDRIEEKGRTEGIEKGFLLEKLKGRLLCWLTASTIRMKILQKS